MLNSFLLTVLVPCYNEENMINIFFAKLSVILKDYNHEIIFIDDGSTDNTLLQLKLLSATNDNVFYLSLSRNFGHQTALKAGYDHAGKGDCVLCLDADLQHPPEVIPELIKKWELGFQIINAIRDNSENLSYLKKCSSRMFYKLINYFSRYRINENGPDFRLVDKKVADVVRSLKEDHIFLREIISWAGFKQANVLFNQQNRRLGTSKYSWRKMFSLCLNAFFAYGINPLRIAVFIGTIFSAISFLYALYAVYSFLFTASTIPGWTSMIASFLLVTGFQFILIGVIGEYLGRTYLQTKKDQLI